MHSTSNPTVFGVVGNTEGDTSLLQEFLAAGANASARDSSLNTVLHFALQVPFVELLIENRADVHAINAQVHTPLFSACLTNRLDVAQSLILRDSNISSIALDRHWLFLMFAVTNCTPYSYDIYSPICLQPANLLVSRGA